MKHGKGIYLMSNGQSKYEGDFRNDLFNGKGKLLYDGGDSYEGEF